jgi:hypothetical protein
VAWSDKTKDDFTPAYWNQRYTWYAAGGIGHVAAYLQTLGLSRFDPKALPPKTAAFWAMVQANEAPESGELRDLLGHLGEPAAVTLGQLVEAAQSLQQLAFADDLRDRRSRRSIPHRLERVGYVPVRNPDAGDGLFKVGGRRQAIYARKALNLADQVRAARAVS